MTVRRTRGPARVTPPGPASACLAGQALDLKAVQEAQEGGDLVGREGRHRTTLLIQVRHLVRCDAAYPWPIPGRY
jgi:hypothetical protein